MPQIKPIRRLAIVNRGEAAMRCIRAVKSLRVLEGLDIQIIALYTNVDRDSSFVRHADVAIPLAARATAVKAYLDHDLLLSTLQEAGVDAVWPGWGFVAEDPVFVDRLAAAGIRFLGPSGDTMRALGDKISSKELAEQAGVPVTDWSNGAVPDPTAAREHAARIGYPVVLKATAGGGGRGIRVVHEESQIDAAFKSASSEAKHAFGDDRLFLESLVRGGRHVEVQIVADQHGNVIALGCRDCSVQRRHQKVIEEAPPPGLTQELLSSLKQSAVKLAQEVGYCGVGTVEFLVQAPHYFFLEMNPRLQVEHGITEEITGTDLVHLQVKIARGERLPALEYPEHGASIEVRVCAEDPDAGFLPAPGRIARFDPALGRRLRVDTGVATGSVVPADFDSLIAKVIANGETREEARARMVDALLGLDVVVEGGATNKGFLLELLEAEEFKTGGVHTAWVDQWLENRDVTRPYAADALVLAAVLTYRCIRDAHRKNFYADADSITHDKIPPSAGEEVDLNYKGRQYRLNVYAAGNANYRAQMGGRAVAAQLNSSGDHAARLKVGKRNLRVLYDVTDSNIRVEVEGAVHNFGRRTAGHVTAGAPSMVVAVHVAVGDRVEAGQSLGLLEAMKMEMQYEAPISGTVTEVRVRAGQQCAAGTVMLIIDPSGEGDKASNQSPTLELPEETDPLAVLYRSNEGGVLTDPDLETAAAADAATQREAFDAVGYEIHRVVLGYDAYLRRVHSLVAFLEAPVSPDLPKAFLQQLAEMHTGLKVLADIETLFSPATPRDERGQLGQSNNARTRVYVRRLHARGAGLPDDFLDLIKTALAHYDPALVNLDPSEDLELVVLRLFASQLRSTARWRLAEAMLRRVMDLANLGVELPSKELRKTLARIAALRGQLPHSLADLALDVSYCIFERPALERAADQRLDEWLGAGGAPHGSPPQDLLGDLVLAPSGRFRGIERWLGGDEPRKRALALAGFIRRLYAPAVPVRHDLGDDGTSDRVEMPDGGTILARVSKSDDVASAAAQLHDDAAGVDGEVVLELLVQVPNFAQRDELVQAVEQALGGQLNATRFTLTLVAAHQQVVHETITRSESGSIERTELYGLHPEAARRVGLERYAAFELDPISARGGVYCFVGQSREVPDDKRVFVLVDVFFRPAGDNGAASFVPMFERAFFEATRTLRATLVARDPMRRLKWNRVALFLAHPIEVGQDMTLGMSRRLAPATRHLGLERVSVQAPVIDARKPDQPPKMRELIVSDVTGAQLQMTWRKPRGEPLAPLTDYVRRVIAARRRGLVYPYELIKMLAPSEPPKADATDDGSAIASPLPLGSFEEFDLEEEKPGAKAVSVAGRDPGQNTSGIVFGVISTPTDKVPEGMRRVAIISDPTRALGALAAPECDRIVAAITLAEELRVPVEWVAVSSGAKISMSSGTENLDATARVVKRIVTFTQTGGTIHVIVPGINVGAQSYWDALATMLLHTRGILVMTPNASMVLTGRAALAVSGSVSAEDEVSIGGYGRIMGPNGQAQFFAEDLGEAYRILYTHYSFTYVVPGERRPRRLKSSDPATRSVLDVPYPSAEFEKIGDLFDEKTNPGRKRPFSMRALMSAVIDQDGAHLERWQSMVSSETAIIWDAHLGGHPVCLIGIESQNVPRWGYRPLDGPAEFNGGTLFPVSSKKVARAINAASGNRPVVVLANLSGFDGSPESMRKLQLEYGAEIARAVVNFEGPLLFLVVSRYHGGAYVVFSQELNPGLRAMAVEGSFASVIGGGPAAAVVFPREVDQRTSKDERIVAATQAMSTPPTPAELAQIERLRSEVKLEKQGQLAAEFDKIHCVERAREVGSLTSIIAAREIRSHLVECLTEAAK